MISVLKASKEFTDLSLCSSNNAPPPEASGTKLLSPVVHMGHY